MRVRKVDREEKQTAGRVYRSHERDISTCVWVVFSIRFAFNALCLLRAARFRMYFHQLVDYDHRIGRMKEQKRNNNSSTRK